MDMRPMHLNLMLIKFPITAIVSILHRITGVVLFLFIPILLWLMDISLTNAEGFNYIKKLLQLSTSKALLFIGFAAFLYHLFAGIRHLIMDCGYFESLNAAKTSSKILLIVFLILLTLMGICIW